MSSTACYTTGYTLDAEEIVTSQAQARYDESSVWLNLRGRRSRHARFRSAHRRGRSREIYGRQRLHQPDWRGIRLDLGFKGEVWKRDFAGRGFHLIQW